MFNPNAWAWPQWWVATVLLLGFLTEIAGRGKPKVDLRGNPYEYSALTGFIRLGLWLFPLVYAGFFAKGVV